MNTGRRQVCAGAVTGLIALLTGTALQAAAGKSGPLQAKVIKIQAHKFVYTPDRITLTAGEHVVLEFTSVDFVHGFAIPDLHVRADLRPGQTTRVSLPPLLAGEYAFLCDNFCGSGHEEMSGSIRVVSRAPSEVGMAQ